MVLASPMMDEMVVKHTFWSLSSDECLVDSRPRFFTDSFLLAEAAKKNSHDDCDSEVDTHAESITESPLESASESDDESQPPVRASMVAPPGCWTRPHPQECEYYPVCFVPVNGFGVELATSSAIAVHETEGSHSVSTVAATPPPELEGRCLTTVMLRNIPNNFTQSSIVELLNKNGFAGLYDFVYLPMDFNRNANLGYAFVNLVSSDAVENFWTTFNDYTWEGPSKKVCGVTWSSPCQGLEEHIERYRNSPLMHESVPDEARPMLFRDGIQVSFPPPTKSIRAPRFRVSYKKQSKR